MAIRDEDEPEGQGNDDTLRMTADIVASFVANNKVSADELAELKALCRTLMDRLEAQSIP